MITLRPAILAAALLAAAGTAWAGGGKIAWESDFKKGLAEAKSSGRPVLIYFTADW